MYRCGVCNHEYETLEERNVCETKCIKERKEAEANLHRQKLEEEKKKYDEEITAKFNELKKLVHTFSRKFQSNPSIFREGLIPKTFARIFDNAWWM